LDISIIGTGYVGLVTGAGLATLGHRVICVDQVRSRVEVIASGHAPFSEPGLDNLVGDTVASGRLSAVEDLGAAVRATELTLITVGTPDNNGEIDLTQVRHAARSIGDILRHKPDYHAVAVKSTVVPTTTDSVVLPELEAGSGKKVGADIGLCVNPEFLREGEAVADFMDPDRIIIGSFDARSAAALSRVYDKFNCPKLVTSLRNAEFIKYASNAFLATCISFANEFAGLCEATSGADVEAVFDGLHLDKRLSPSFGGERIRPGILSYLRPSSGYGGSCLPKDVAALRRVARTIGASTMLMDAVAAVNEARTDKVVDMAEERIGPLINRRVALLGLTFKAGTDDLRHSPAVALALALVARGATVSVHDPIATQLAMPLLGDRVSYASGPMEAAAGADLIVIGAAWPQWRDLDWLELSRTMRGSVVFDPRNSMRDFDFPAGLTRFGIGVGPAKGIT
jgi:UDPglucose 6-dehydrogenase/GDP-mannose 6-dehydrogenase